MSSPAEQLSFVLIRRADGRVEWIPLETVPQRVPVIPGATYAIIERTDYEAPRALQAERLGEDLLLEVGGKEVLTLAGFFSADGVTFYPTTDMAGGSGAFSGPALTSGSPVLPGSSGSEQLVWSAAPTESQRDQESGAESGGGALAWVGVGAGLLGVAALAGGGGGSGGGGDSGGGGGPPPPPSDTAPPQITSGATAPSIAENSGPGKVVYTATATDAGTVTYSLKADADAAAFSIDGGSGVVTLIGDPDFETKASYSFTVVARDGAGNSSEQPVTVAVTDVNDTPPTPSPIAITSLPTATAIDENGGAGRVVYTVTSNATGPVTYGLKPGSDAEAFSIDANTGAVTLIGNPDHETKSSYQFGVVATAGTSSAELVVNLPINDKDDLAPSITSGTTANIDENLAGRVVYTVTSTDTGDVSTGNTTYSLKPGGDAAAFSINSNTGTVTLTAGANHEVKSSYSFTVVAADVAGNRSERAIALTINDKDEVAPSITSSSTPPAINENGGAGRTVYTVTSTDTGDVSTGSTTYSLTGADAAAFGINPSTGVVTLTGDADHETKSSYSFTAVATDAAGHRAERAVTLAVNDRDEVAPTITSGTTANPIDEQSGAGQVIYTVMSTDTGDVSTGSTTYSLAGADAAAFSINPTNGEVTLTGNPDFETKSTYNFTVVATDQAGNSSEKGVLLAIRFVDDPGDVFAPTLSSTSPAEGEEDVPVDQNIVLTFNEDVQAGSGAIHIRVNGPGDEEIDVTDNTQVSISGSVVTINPTEDLDFGRNYSVSVDSGAFTDLAGNEFDGLFDLDFETANDDDDDFTGSSLEAGRSFQPEPGAGIEILDKTPTTADAEVATWEGSEALGSEDKITLVASGADVQNLSLVSDDSGAAPVDSDAESWQSDIALDSSPPNGSLEGQGGQVSAAHFENIAPVIVTSQGLV